MNILIYNLGYKRYSGGVYYVDGLACAFAEQGHNVTLLTNVHNKSAFNLNYPNLERVVNSHYVPPNKKYNYILSIHNNPMIISSRYARIRKIPFIPIIFELPNWVRKYIPEHRVTNASWAYIKEPLKNSTKILCLANECIKYIYELSPETVKKPKYVIEGIINDIVADKVAILDIKPENKSVCWIGGNAVHKRVLDLIKAIRLLDDYKEWKINYITPVHDINNTKIAKDIGINLNMVVSPNDEQKFRIISQSSMVISTSRFEGGVCMSILEALYMKRRVISYKLPIHVDCCKDLITYVPIGNIKDLAIAIDNNKNYIVDNNSETSGIDNKTDVARKYVENNFTIKSVGRKLNDMLDVK